MLLFCGTWGFQNGLGKRLIRGYNSTRMGLLSGSSILGHIFPCSQVFLLKPHEDLLRMATACQEPHIWESERMSWPPLEDSPRMEAPNNPLGSFPHVIIGS